jgi:hypothetical protein
MDIEFNMHLSFYTTCVQGLKGWIFSMVIFIIKKTRAMMYLCPGLFTRESIAHLDRGDFGINYLSKIVGEGM